MVIRPHCSHPVGMKWYLVIVLLFFLFQMRGSTADERGMSGFHGIIGEESTSDQLVFHPPVPDILFETELTMDANKRKKLLSHVHGKKIVGAFNAGSRPHETFRPVSSAFMEKSVIPVSAATNPRVEIPHTPFKAPKLPSNVKPWNAADLTKCDTEGCWTIDTTDVETQRTLHALKFAVALHTPRRACCQHAARAAQPATWQALALARACMPEADAASTENPGR